MTNKDFFLKVLNDEAPRFRAVIESLPDEQMEHKVHDKSRTASSLAGQLAVQWVGISNIITKGDPLDGDYYKGEPSKIEILKSFDKEMEQLRKDLAEISEEHWENDEATMGEMWKTKKYWMAWGFLFDAIHHRGQLSTFLRAMGAKVPSIYGPSADTK